MHTLGNFRIQIYIRAVTSGRLKKTQILRFDTVVGEAGQYAGLLFREPSCFISGPQCCATATGDMGS